MFRDHLHVIDTWIVGHKPLFSRLFIDIDVEDLVLHLHNHLLAKKRFTFINGKRNGKGVMRYRNGRQYEGYWERDLRDGKGFERYLIF